MRETDRRKAALFVFLAALTACSPSKSTVDAGPQPLTACTSNAECTPLGLECDLSLLKCVCTEDSQCPGANPYCNVFTGRCEASLPAGACTSTSCPAGEYCDEGTRACAPVLGFCAQCTDDAECGAGNYCIVHPMYPGTPPFCASACSANGTCAAGQSCEATSANVKQCVPSGALCNSRPNCVADSLSPCDGGMCGDSTQTCNPNLMACVAITSGCAQDQACDPSTLQCVEPCGEGADAGQSGDQECQSRFGNPSFVCINNVCRPAAQCAMDSECPLNEFCAMSPTAASGSLGNCEPACTTSNDCPEGQLCVTNMASGRQGCQAGCKTNADCPLTAICSSTGVCESMNSMNQQYCQTKQVCPFKSQCTNNVCVSQPLNCSSDNNGCAHGTMPESVAYFTCGTCPQGTTGICPAPADYNPPDLNCSGNECVCSFTTCLTTGCTTDDSCPSGFNCESLNGTAFCSPVNDAEYCLP